MRNGKYETVYAFKKGEDTLLIQGKSVKKIQSISLKGQNNFSRKKLFEITGLSLDTDKLSALRQVCDAFDALINAGAIEDDYADHLTGEWMTANEITLDDAVLY